jgi:O-antigen/teichoic acid export membrane protein
MEFISSSLDTILIGRFFGSVSLGFYNRAQMLINLPMQYFTSSFSKVLFPSFSQIQNDNERVKKNIFLILQIVFIIIFPFAIIVNILAKEIVEILLGPKWLDSVVFLKVLSFVAATSLLTHFIAVLFEAKGLLKHKIIIQSFYIILLTISFYFALRYGVIGFTFALLACQIVFLFHYIFYFLKEFKTSMITTLKHFISPGITSLIVFVGTYWFHQFIRNYQLHNYQSLTLTLLFFIIIYLFILYSKINAQIRVELYNRFR